MKKESKRPLTLEWRTPAELEDNPANWRKHPEAQMAALQAVVGEVGWAGAALYNKTTGHLIDGHARKKMAGPDEKIPVLVGEWTEEQEKKILLTLDPLAGMAEVDLSQFIALQSEVSFESPDVSAMLAGIVKANATMDMTTAPEAFKELNEGLEANALCPRCGFAWSAPPE
jgi:hypothetical protein